MWYEYLSNNVFIKQLYNQIPSLKNVIIEDFLVSYYGESAKLSFEMPKWVDIIPKKWEIKKYNSVMITIGFADVKDLTFSIGKERESDIYVTALDEHKIKIVMTGGINGKFTAEAGVIQKVEGYIK